MNLIGQKFGKWTVIEKYDGDKWLCKCDCGTVRGVSQKNLLSGNSKSCGTCIKYGRHRPPQFNNYEETEEYMIGYTNNDVRFIFDKEDYDIVRPYCWSIHSKGYFASRTGDYKRYILLHRLIMNCPEGMFVDHIGGSATRYDNRKQNLRIVTPSQNNFNRPCLGVFKSGNRYVAMIKANGKKVRLGSFNNIEDAIAARKKAEIEMFGEYSFDNSQAYYRSFSQK